MSLLPSETSSHSRLRNVFQSVVLIATMLAILAVVGNWVAGPIGLLFFGILGVIVLVLSPRVSPGLILRLYRAAPLTGRESPFLHNLLAELSNRARLPKMPRLYYLPTHLVTAFTMGSRRNSVICVSDGLLRIMNGRELAGVLAHEINHIRSNDVWIMGLTDFIGRVTTFFSQLGLLLLLINLPMLLMDRLVVPWAVVLLLVFAPTLTALLQLGLSRTREYEADRGAVDLIGDPRGLASALVKMERVNAGVFERILLPGRRIPEPSLLRTHPPTDERVRRLLALEAATESRRMTSGDESFPDARQIPQRVTEPPGWHWSTLWF